MVQTILKDKFTGVISAGLVGEVVMSPLSAWHPILAAITGVVVREYVNFPLNVTLVPAAAGHINAATVSSF